MGYTQCPKKEIFHKNKETLWQEGGRYVVIILILDNRTAVFALILGADREKPYPGLQRPWNAHSRCNVLNWKRNMKKVKTLTLDASPISHTGLLTLTPVFKE